MPYAAFPAFFIILAYVRSSHPELFCKKSALENFPKLTGKHLFQILLFNKVVGIRSVTLLKKRLRHRVFPVNFVKFSRTPFFRTPLAAASGISAIHNDSSPFFY